MALVTKSIKGTLDLLPNESYKRQFVEHTCLEIAQNFGYKEIRTPVFEHTELFQRGVGDTTDVVPCVLIITFEFSLILLKSVST